LPVHASSTWSPGFYSGWVSFNARIDSNVSLGSVGGFVIEQYSGRGQLMVKVNDLGQGGASIVLPVGITILDYGTIKGNGDCTFSSTAVAQTNYVRLRNEVTDISETIQIPISLSPGIRFQKTNSASFGSLQGCDQAGGKNLEAMKKAMRVTTGEMQQMTFTVGFNSGASAGGTCTIVGWEKTTAIPHGQGIRSLPSCKWRVFKVMTPNQGGEWKR
jgi:hypothetical protein